MKHSRPGEASQRQLRVGELIRRALADLLQQGEIHDPAFARTVVTISEVRVTADLKTATAYFMPLGGQRIKAVTAAFERNLKPIRHEVSKRVSLQHTPAIRFRIDPSFDEGDHIDSLLRSSRVTRDLSDESSAQSVTDGDDTEQA